MDRASHCERAVYSSAFVEESDNSGDISEQKRPNSSPHSSQEERSDDVVGRGDDEGRGDDGGPGRRGGDYRKKTKEMGHVCGGDRRKAKSSILFRFGKVEKQVPRKNKRAANPSSPGCFGRGVGAAGGGGGGCCRCFKQTPTVDSPLESQTSDPNNPELLTSC